MSPLEFQQQIYKTVAQHLFDLSLKDQFHDPEIKLYTQCDMFDELKKDAYSKQYKDVLSRIEFQVNEINEQVASIRSEFTEQLAVTSRIERRRAFKVW